MNTTISRQPIPKLDLLYEQWDALDFEQTDIFHYTEDLSSRAVQAGLNAYAGAVTHTGRNGDGSFVFNYLYHTSNNNSFHRLIRCEPWVYEIARDAFLYNKKLHLVTDGSLGTGTIITAIAFDLANAAG